MKIRTKISLSFSVATFLFVAIACSIVYVKAEISVISEVEERLKGIAAEKDRHIETYLKMMSNMTVQLAKSVTLEKFLKAEKNDPQNCGELFELSMEQLNRRKDTSQDIREFLLMNAKGKVIASTDRKLIGSDQSDDVIFLGGQKDIFIKDAYISDTTGHKSIAFSYPIIDSKSGDFLGVMTAVIKLDMLENLMRQSVGLAGTGETYIVNKYGFMITPSIFIKDVFLSQKVDTKNFRQCVLDRRVQGEADEARHLTEERVILAPDYRGVRTFGAHTYVANMDWYVMAEIDELEALKPITSMRKILAIIIVIIPAAAWLIGSYLSGIIVKPIRILAEGMKIVGGGDLDYRVSTDSRDEIGSLSVSFDLMIRNLKTITASVGELNRHIAAHKLAEEKMKELAASWQVTFDSIMDPIAIQDKDFNLVRVNKAYSTLTNIEADKLIGKHCFEVVHGTEGPPDKCPHVQVLKSGKPVTEEVFEPSLKKWYTVSVSPIFNDRGEVSQVVHFMRDITERKADEEKLKEQLVQLEKMNKFMVDRELTMIEMKEKIRRLERNAGGN